MVSCCWKWSAGVATLPASLCLLLCGEIGLIPGHCCVHRYGILLLVVECMGASTVLTYGVWLLYSPVQEDFTEDPHNPGLPKVQTLSYFPP